MPTVSNSNLGPLISCLVPGGVFLAGISSHSPAVAAWLSAGE